MKVLLMLLFIVLGCGSDEPKTFTLQNPPEQLGEIETVYADLKERFTQQEFQLFIEAVKTHCESDPYNSAIHRKLKQRLSPDAYSVIFSEDMGLRMPYRIPLYTRHKADRIKLAANEHDGNAIFLNRREKVVVVYVFNDVEATIIVETDINPVTKLYRIRVSTIITGDGTRHDEVRSIKNQIEELNEAHNGSDKPLPIELPAMTANLPITVLVFDEHTEPIPPTPEEYHQWIFDYDDAPLATDAQIEHENQRITPSAFDCVEN